MRAFDNDLDELGVAFTHPSDRAQDLIFCDLRAKTKFGRLKHVGDIAPILLHRVPGSRPTERKTQPPRFGPPGTNSSDTKIFAAHWLAASAGPPVGWNPRRKKPIACASVRDCHPILTA